MAIREDNLLLCVLLLLAVIKGGATFQSVNFYPTEDLPVEQGNDVTFYCDVTGSPGVVGFHLPEYSKMLWMTFPHGNSCGFSDGDDASIVDFEASCSFIKNMFRFSIKISSIPERLHNGKVLCEVKYMYSNNVDIIKGIDLYINIPVVKVDIDAVQNITISEYNAINISCSARSRPLSTITWYISGKPIIDNYTIEINDTIINSTMTYTGNRRHNNGKLYCKADRGNNEVESASVYLNVTYPPEVSVIPIGLPVEGVPTYTITCDVIESNPFPYVFYWYRGIEKIEERSGNVLVISSLNRTHSDNYTCHAKNSEGDSPLKTTYIDVLYKGSIVQFHPTKLSVNTGELVIAKTKVEGKPLPNVTWSNDRTSSIVLREENTTNSSLNITTVCEDTGNYTLGVDNGLGDIDTRKFRIEVSCKPYYVTTSTSTIVNNGERFLLETTFIAYPKPRISWYYTPTNTHTKTPVLTDSNMVISTESDEAVHTSTVAVERANSTHNGLFFVTVSNSIGADVQLFYVSVTEQPSINSEQTSTTTIGIVSGVLGGTIVVVAILILGFVYHKRKAKENIYEDFCFRNTKENVYEN